MREPEDRRNSVRCRFALLVCKLFWAARDGMLLSMLSDMWCSFLVSRLSALLASLTSVPVAICSPYLSSPQTNTFNLRALIVVYPCFLCGCCCLAKTLISWRWSWAAGAGIGCFTTLGCA